MQSPINYVKLRKLSQSKTDVPTDVETQKSGNKKSSGEIGLDIRTHASPKVGQDQMFGGVSVPCWHATPVAYILLKPLQFSNVKFGK